ncbi:MAG TPA: M1 family aminopeptidase [Patescibacteria group bacterium]|nr:M1 family aminopeptidase [Patescibacteria group bacterium]
MRKHLRTIMLYVPLLIVLMWTSLGLVERAWPVTDPFVRYHLSYRDRKLDVVTVSVTVFGAGGDRIAFYVPDAGGRPPEPICLTAVTHEGDTLGVKRGDGRWVVSHGGRDFNVNYDLTLTVADRYRPEIDNMLTLLDGDRYRIIGRDVFIIPECTVARGVVIDMELGPPGSQRSAWPSNGGRIVVPAIETVPLTVAVSGDYRFMRTTVGGTEVKFSIAGEWLFSDRELFDLVCRIVSHEISLFGSSPHDSYLFVCDRNPVKSHDTFGNFGVHFSRNMILLLDPRLDRSDLFDTPVSIIAHEFFHNWNGDAIRPASDELLWFTEGVTVYYSYRILLDLSVIAPVQYEARRAYIASRYRDNPYRTDVAIASAANSDLTDRDMVNLLYNGGFLAAEALDLHLAGLTGGSVRLIDVLRSLYHDGIDGGLDEAALCEAIRRVGGVDLSLFLHGLVHEPAPEVLSEAAQQVGCGSSPPTPSGPTLQLAPGNASPAEHGWSPELRRTASSL